MTLSDKIVDTIVGRIINIVDLKASIKELKEIFNEWEIDSDVQSEVLNGIFGAELNG